MALYQDGTEILSDLAVLAKKEIVSAGQPILFNYVDRRTWVDLAESIALLSIEDQRRIRQVAIQRQAARQSDHRSKRQKLSHRHEVPTLEEPAITENGVGDSGFLQAPKQEVVDGCITRFIDRMSNDALSMCICAACARSLPISDTEEMDVNSIPNGQLLIPCEAHPAHQLTCSMLLEKTAVSDDQRCGLCVECKRNLEKKCIPRLALANDMWMGPVPFELALLTLPEQVLIA
jgi:hypothetical protein